MSRMGQITTASLGVFTGSLLSDIYLGDGLQLEDMIQAAMVALVAGLIQAWITRNRKKG